MLQTSDAPATPPGPPTPPTPPQTPTAVTLPGGGTIEIVGSPAQLQGLRERRDMLRDQLERALNRRSSLVSQLEGREGHDVSPEARVGVQQRLTLLDERIMQIERDQALTERAISNAPSEVLAQAANERSQRDGYNDDDAAGFAFGGVLGGIMLTMLVSRVFRWRRARNGRGKTPVSMPLAEQDPRFERLSQTVDAMAEELERIGEGQRFVTQLLSRRQDAPALAVESERQ